MRAGNLRPLLSRWQRSRRRRTLPNEAHLRQRHLITGRKSIRRRLCCPCSLGGRINTHSSRGTRRGDVTIAARRRSANPGDRQQRRRVEKAASSCKQMDRYRSTSIQLGFPVGLAERSRARSGSTVAKIVPRMIRTAVWMQRRRPYLLPDERRRSHSVVKSARERKLERAQFPVLLAARKTAGDK